MALKSIECPECGHLHDVPAPGTKKITCESCGMILVMRKLIGDDWEAQLEAAAAGSAPAPAAKKVAKRAGKPSASKKAPAVRRRGKAPAAEEEEEAPSRGRRGSRGSSRRPTTRGSSRKRGAAAPPPEEESGSRGRPTGYRPKKKESVSPALMLGSLVGVIAIGAVAFFMLKGEGDENTDAGTEKASTEQTTTDDTITSGADEDGEPMLDDVTGDEAGDPAETADADTEKKEAPAKEKKSDQYGPFESTPGTSDDELAAIKKHIETLKDLDATREATVAMSALIDMPKKSIPHLINAVMEVQTDDEADVARGWQIMQTLKNASAREDKWYRSFFVPQWPEDASAVAKEAKDRVIVRKQWWRWWNENKDTWEPPKEDEEDDW